MSDLNEHNERIAGLVFKYLLRKLSEDERAELNEWIAASENNQVQFDEMTRRPELRVKLNEYNQVDTQKIWQKIADQVPAVNEAAEESTGTVRKGRVLWFRIAIAAAVIGIIVFAGWLYFTTGPQKEAAPQIVTTNDVAPGGNKAVLILSDGKKVILDEAQQGTIAQQGKTIINKTKEGELTYKANSPLTIDHSPLTYNTITTPRGGQYHVVLPDGSHVWLNAASSIHFPTQFTGKEREVKLSGEAYFEVAPANADGKGKKPFVVSLPPPDVKGAGVMIKVLGTHFNVKAYNDEASVSTTLIEGKVRISSGSSIALLTPGKQAQISSLFGGSQEGAIKVVDNADTEEAIAWKNGLIAANRATIKEALMQISRWYDVDLVFKNEIKEEDIRIRVPRTASLASVLKIFELSSQLRFEIKGNKLIVWQQ